MNIIRTIESVTLVSIGALCATAVLSIAVHASQILPSSDSGAFSNVATVASVELAPVVVHAKRLTAAQKESMIKAHAVG
jgi:hypothetical protein